MAEAVTREDKFFKIFLREEKNLLKKIAGYREKGIFRKKMEPVEEEIKDINEIKKDVNTLKQILWKYHRLVEQHLFNKLQNTLEKIKNVQSEIEKLEKEQKEDFVEELLPGYLAALLMIAAWERKVSGNIEILGRNIDIEETKNLAKSLSNKNVRKSIKDSIKKISFEEDNIEIVTEKEETKKAIENIYACASLGGSINIKQQGNLYIIRINNVKIDDLRKELDKKMKSLRSSLLAKLKESEEAIKTAAELVGISAKEINLDAIGNVLKKAKEKLEKIEELQKRLEKVEEKQEELTNAIKEALHYIVDVLDDIEDAGDLYALLLDTFVVEQLAVLIKLAKEFNMEKTLNEIKNKLKEIGLEARINAKIDVLIGKLEKSSAEKREEIIKTKIYRLLDDTIKKLRSIISSSETSSKTASSGTS